ncbi:MAG: indolepyruvate ferredoxin oxidoreductase family protein, partial [Hyphomicrobiaceae bacterium]|nr:indolepyruvate ferredoxin oxidoreductase family protein [Hyphomicrobiaceae bacterium]
AAIDRIAKRQAEAAAPKQQGLDEIVARRAALLEDYQDAGLAARYRAKINWLADLEKEKTPGRSGLAEAAARAYHKVLAYKDEYEVARLHTDEAFERQVAANFDGVKSIAYHLAPPLLARFWRDPVTGHPRKIRLGAWMRPVFKLLRKGKALRGTRWDVFGYSAERRRERQLIADYEVLLDRIAAKLKPENHAVATALAGIPMEIKGFGHVKQANHERAMRRWKDLLDDLDNPTPVRHAAE